jgi:hypothetical protein
MGRLLSFEELRDEAYARQDAGLPPRNSFEWAAFALRCPAPGGRTP